MLERLRGILTAFVSGLAFVVASACASGGATESVRARTPPSEVIVLMRGMTGLVLEWQFFNAHADSIAAGIDTAKSPSWCAKIPVPAAAESARLFNGVEDLALDPSKQPYWTLDLANTGAFVQKGAAPC